MRGFLMKIENFLTFSRKSFRSGEMKNIETVISPEKTSEEIPENLEVSRVPKNGIFGKVKLAVFLLLIAAAGKAFSQETKEDRALSTARKELVKEYSGKYKNWIDTICSLVENYDSRLDKLDKKFGFDSYIFWGAANDLCTDEELRKELEKSQQRAAESQQRAAESEEEANEAFDKWNILAKFENNMKLDSDQKPSQAAVEAATWKKIKEYPNLKGLKDAFRKKLKVFEYDTKFLEN